MSVYDDLNTHEALGVPIEWDAAQSLNTASVGSGQTARSIHEDENPTTASAPVSEPLPPFDPNPLSCSCLEELYAVLMSFQSQPPPSFPSSRGPLIEGTKLAKRIVQCPFCPRDYPSAIQNLMLLTTLLQLITYGYAQLQRHIEEQAARGCMITYRVGDTSLANAHLHTSTLDCPMGFNLELESEEWAAMARKVLKQDVYGNSQSIDCLLGAVEELEQRQHIWHLLHPFGATAPCRQRPPSDPSKHNGLCTQLTGELRRAIDALHL
ncbi:MAG: hypothetical protein Q9219_003143 [cf. Caloplaca sp. 3 TL-2023]